MLDIQDYRRSLQRSELSRTRSDRPHEFSMRGRDWDLLSDVFAPIYSPSTGIALDFLGFPGPTGLPGRPRGGSMLEIGCGTGVIAVSAALSRYQRVLATDINPQAVRNARLNAERHGVSCSVRCLRSDLFDAIDPRERFDLIFWSSNYVMAPASYAHRSLHEAAYVDPGYRTHRRFLAEAPERLRPGGRVLLHFCTRGDTGELVRLARECDREVTAVRHRTVQEGQDQVEHLLLEVTAQPAALPDRSGALAVPASLVS
jgi:release factor glutamine methyltransferase